ncbi:hypothetical protein BV22DRAFT_1045269 [Leucogyrophana mollusca]|uniref:Uncharacterized protein n=1 Tax=Leucogyrophana mollusca TaxID=85980 RepID=A0ACB8BQM1_9AGAM|nr:hypothetical protein BV22DRAFT_1045269 [Leucogyrophana mollusca]
MAKKVGDGALDSSMERNVAEASHRRQPDQTSMTVNVSKANKKPSQGIKRGKRTFRQPSPEGEIDLRSSPRLSVEDHRRNGAEVLARKLKGVGEGASRVPQENESRRPPGGSKHLGAYKAALWMTAGIGKNLVFLLCDRGRRGILRDADSMQSITTSEAENEPLWTSGIRSHLGVGVILLRNCCYLAEQIQCSPDNAKARGPRTFEDEGL